MKTFNCNYLTPLHFKGLSSLAPVFEVQRRGSRGCMLAVKRHTTYNVPAIATSEFKPWCISDSHLSPRGHTPGAGRSAGLNVCPAERVPVVVLLINRRLAAGRLLIVGTGRAGCAYSRYAQCWEIANITTLSQKSSHLLTLRNFVKS